MRTRYIRCKPLLIAALVFFIGHSTVAAQDADALVERLKRTYESVDAIRAEFSQRTTSDLLTGEQTSTGTILFRDDHYRVETASQTVVTDGVVTWIYNVLENQVLINDYVEDETTFSLNEFIFDFDEHYVVERIGQEQADGTLHHTLTLSPRKPDSFFSAVTLWMRDNDNLVDRLEVTDMNGSSFTFVLDVIELNPPIEPDAFRFTPPEAADVVDLRS
jgi:outer membrane lipoprotein-sorting protein